MKSLHKISFITLFILGISCNDFLNVNLQNELTQDSFPQSASDALLATNAAYSVLRDWHYHSGGFPILDFMSDDALKGSNPNDALGTVGPYVNFTHQTNQDGLDRWWASLYQGILRANVVIEKVAVIEMDEALRLRYIGEARFIRGLLYFDLVRAFGEVPIVLTDSPDLKVPKSSIDDVYAVIEADLLFAVDALPPKSTYSNEDLGRATEGAAKGLLAKMHLFRQDFVNAEKYALEVIDSGQYDLEADYEDANGQLGEHGVESVFEVGAVSNETGTGNQYSNTQGVRGTPNRGWGFNQPTMDLRAAFEVGDPRRDATIIELGDVLDGILILGDGTTPDEVVDENNVVIARESYNQKVWIPGLNTDTQYGHNRRLLRFADILLIAAEALNENNNSPQALVHLNRVRQRARNGDTSILPDITETQKDALRDIIIQERRVELALEGHRFWDLVRTGKAAEVLGPLGFQQGKHEYLPIPQNEIDISQGTLVQNPAWN